MSRSETIHIERHLAMEELEKRIKAQEKDARILKRLYFVRYLYEGRTVKEASELVGITKCNGYIWQEPENYPCFTREIKPRLWVFLATVFRFRGYRVKEY